MTGRLLQEYGWMEGFRTKIRDLVLPSLEWATKGLKCFPCLGDTVAPDMSAPKVTYYEYSKLRLQKYLDRLQCQTSSFMPNQFCLWADMALFSAEDRGEAYLAEGREFR